MSEAYNFHKRATLPANGAAVSLNISGSYFRVIEASAGKFEMSFDGGNFFEFQKGLKLKFPETGFKKVWFRILAGTAVLNLIAFYYGTAEVDDSRLNVIDESALATIYTKPALFVTQSIYNGAGAAEAVATSIPLLDGSDRVLRSIGWGFSSLTGGPLELRSTQGGKLLQFVANSGEIFAGDGEDYTLISIANVTAKGNLYATYWQ